MDETDKRSAVTQSTGPNQTDPADQHTPRSTTRGSGNEAPAGAREDTVHQAKDAPTMDQVFNMHVDEPGQADPSDAQSEG